MNGARAPPAAISVGDLLNLEVAAGSPTFDAEGGPLSLLAEVHESEDAGEKRRRNREIPLPQSNGVQPANLFLHRHGTAGPWSEHTLVGGLVKGEGQSVRIRERQRRGLPAHLHLADRNSVLDEAVRPVIQ